MSYGASLLDAYRQARRLRRANSAAGEKPADLPILQATKFESAINPQNRKGARSPSRQHCSRVLTR